MQVLLVLEFSAFGTQFRDADTRRIINNQMRLTNYACCLNQLLPIRVLQITGSDSLRIHLGLHRHNTIDQLLFWHFQTEYGYRLAFMQGNILGNIQYKCSFTHRWSGRYQNKIGRLHTRCLVIQIQKTCSNTRYIAMAVRSSLNLSHGVCNNLSDGHIVTGISSLYKIKNAFLCIFQNCL